MMFAEEADDTCGISARIQRSNRYMQLLMRSELTTFGAYQGQNLVACDSVSFLNILEPSGFFTYHQV